MAQVSSAESKPTLRVNMRSLLFGIGMSLIGFTWADTARYTFLHFYEKTSRASLLPFASLWIYTLCLTAVMVTLLIILYRMT
jgi:hypothetical protein